MYIYIYTTHTHTHTYISSHTRKERTFARPAKKRRQPQTKKKHSWHKGFYEQEKKRQLQKKFSARSFHVTKNRVTKNLRIRGRNYQTHACDIISDTFWNTHAHAKLNWTCLLSHFITHTHTHSKHYATQKLEQMYAHTYKHVHVQDKLYLDITTTPLRKTIISRKCATIHVPNILPLAKYIGIFNG